MTECHPITFCSNWALVTIPITQRVPFFASSMTVGSQPARFCMKTEETFRRRTTETKKRSFFTSGWGEPLHLLPHPNEYRATMVHHMWPNDHGIQPTRPRTSDVGFMQSLLSFPCRFMTLSPNIFAPTVVQFTIVCHPTNTSSQLHGCHYVGLRGL